MRRPGCAELLRRRWRTVGIALVILCFLLSLSSLHPASSRLLWATWDEPPHRHKTLGLEWVDGVLTRPTDLPRVQLVQAVPLEQSNPVGPPFSGPRKAHVVTVHLPEWMEVSPFHASGESMGFWDVAQAVWDMCSRQRCGHILVLVHHAEGFTPEQTCSDVPDAAPLADNSVDLSLLDDLLSSDALTQRSRLCWALRLFAHFSHADTSVSVVAAGPANGFEACVHTQQAASPVCTRATAECVLSHESDVVIGAALSRSTGQTLCGRHLRHAVEWVIPPLHEAVWPAAQRTLNGITPQWSRVPETTPVMHGTHTARYYAQARRREPLTLVLVDAPWGQGPMAEVLRNSLDAVWHRKIGRLLGRLNWDMYPFEDGPVQLAARVFQPLFRLLAELTPGSIHQVSPEFLSDRPCASMCRASTALTSGPQPPEEAWETAEQVHGSDAFLGYKYNTPLVYRRALSFMGIAAKWRVVQARVPLLRLLEHVALDHSEFKLAYPPIPPRCTLPLREWDAFDNANVTHVRELFVSRFTTAHNLFDREKRLGRARKRAWRIRPHVLIPAEEACRDARWDRVSLQDISYNPYLYYLSLWRHRRSQPLPASIPVLRVSALTHMDEQTRRQINTFLVSGSPAVPSSQQIARVDESLSVVRAGLDAMCAQHHCREGWETAVKYSAHLPVAHSGPLQKTVFSKRRVVFVVGREGTGHHFLASLWDKLRAAGAHSNGDGIQLPFLHGTSGYDDASVRAYERLRSELEKLPEGLEVVGTYLWDPSRNPVYFGMMSFPNFGGWLAMLQNVNVADGVRLCEEMGIDARVIWLRRPLPFSVLSNVRRYFSINTFAHAGTDLLYNTFALSHAQRQIEYQMTQLDPEFITPVTICNLSDAQQNKAMFRRVMAIAGDHVRLGHPSYRDARAHFRRSAEKSRPCDFWHAPTNIPGADDAGFRSAWFLLMRTLFAW